MKLIDKLKNILDVPTDSSQQILISDRNALMRNRSRYVADWVYSYDSSLICSDGSKLQIDAENSVITGTSAFKNEILTRQIVAGISNGYIPFVISANGKNGLLYRVLRSIYNESAINYVSKEYASGQYNPFMGISADKIADFFYQLVCDFQLEQTNGMLVRNYVNVCVAVFFSNGNTVENLVTGQLDHMRLLREIEGLSNNNIISENTRRQLANTANSAQSVSVLVLSVIQDYIYKFKKICNPKPTIKIRGVNSPQIRILGVNGNTQVSLEQSNINLPDNGFGLSSLADGKCFYLELDNEVSRNFRNSLNEQCFQWYMARTLKLEIESKLELKNRAIMVIIDDLSDAVLDWFWWTVSLPNSVKLIIYDDLYSMLSASQDHRQQLIGMAKTIYFFSVINEESASWASRIFGVHMVSKVVVTNQPIREWTDIIFPPKAYAHDEVEKPWFSSHEIQHLGNMGIVYSKNYKIFKPYYRENGRTYVDQNYKRQKVNFCLFEFR